MKVRSLVFDDAPDILKPARRRAALIHGMVAILFLVVAGRLYQVQVVQGAFWKRLSREEHSIRVSITTKRATIFDRGMNKLALSAETLSLYAIPPELGERAEEIARALAPVVEMSAEVLLERFRRPRNFVWIKRDAPPQVVEFVRGLKTSGLRFKTEFRRVYPRGNLAAQLIGGVGNDDRDLLDNKGLEGVEWAFDDTLAGEEIRERILRDPANTEYKGEPVDRRGGRAVTLTIDEIIQHIVEQEIDAAHREWNPEFTIALVMNPETGELLALGTRPTYDNARVGDFPPAARRNRAVFDLYEPGSVFKIFTFAAAIDAGAVGLADRFHCPGSITIHDRFRIGCHGVTHGDQQTPVVFANSCNVCSVHTAQKLGARQFSAALDRFAFRERVDLLPRVDEPRGLLAPDRRWSALSLPSISIGQEVALTAPHLLRAACSVLNDGIMMKAMLVREVETAAGNRQVFFPEAAGRVFSPATAAHMKRLMRQVVVSGTGRAADIPGYHVMGKTGSAQIASPRGGYLEGKWTTSFLGFVEEPGFKVAILVSLKDPSKKGVTLKEISGGRIAAPVFRRIAERILMYRQILPTNMRVNTVVRISDRRTDWRVPDLVGRPLADAERLLSGEVELSLRGDGPLVVKQFPPQQRLMSRRDPLLLFLGGADDLEANRASRVEPFMRHFIGKSLRESLEMLQGLRQPVYIEGSGFVVEQEPGAGTPLSDDTRIRLKLAAMKR